MRTFKTAIILVGLIVTTASCKKGGVFCYKGDGNIVTEVRSHTDFSKISIEMGADLYIEQGETYEVKVEASENIQEIIETKVVGSTLEIDLKKGKCLKNSYEVKVYVVMPELDDISISGSGDVSIDDLFVGNRLDVSISGSGNLDFDQLDYNELDVSISGSGDLFLNSVDTLVSESINISGSGEIHSYDLPAKHVEIKVSGSGDCEVHAVETLDISISGSGDVSYKGNPIIDQSISGSGSVKPW